MIKLWKVLITLTSLVSIWFFGLAVSKLWEYYSLNASTKGVEVRWTVIQAPSAKFAIEAFYHFQVAEKVYEGKTSFADPLFLSPLAAETAIKEIEQKQWDVWYNQSNPNKSSLQKLFPFKACIHFLLTFAVVLYFFFLRNFLLRMAI